jgi:hypothetical protein
MQQDRLHPRATRLVDTINADQLDSTTRGTFLHGFRTQEMFASIKGPFLCASPCQPSPPLPLRLWRPPPLFVLDLPHRSTAAPVHRKQNLLALASCHRPDARLPSPVTVIALFPAAALWTQGCRQQARFLTFMTKLSSCFRPVNPSPFGEPFTRVTISSINV